MKNNVKFTLFVGFILVFSLGFGTANAATVDNTKNPDKIVIQTPSGPQNIDPASNYESAGGAINGQVCEKLVRYVGDTSEVEGSLATSWTVSPDALQYNFTIRDNVYFTDGVKMNAWIMKYSIDRLVIMNDPQGASWLITDFTEGSNWYFNNFEDANVSQALTYLHNATRGVDDLVVLDDMTLQLNLRQPGPILKVLEYESFCAVSPRFVIENRPGKVGGNDSTSTTPWTLNVNDDTYGIVPLDQWFPTLNATQAWDKLGLDTTDPAFDFRDSGVVPNSGIALDAEHLWYKDHQVGTGPYKVQSITDTEQSIVKNNNWWKKADFHANAPDEVVWQIVGESATRFLALKSGDADFAQGLAAAQTNELVRNENGIALRPFTSLVDNIKLYNSPGLVHTDVFFNFNETLPSTYIGESAGSFYNVTHDEKGTASTADDVARPLYKYGEGHPTWQWQLANQTNPFTSVLFRKAFAMSLDVQALINTAYNGLGIIPQGNIPSSMVGAVDDLIDNGYQPTYDPDGAKQLFESIGWQGTITVAANQGNIQRKTTGLLLKDVIESFQIGISINVLEMVWATFLTERNRGVFPVSVSGWGADYVDPHNFVVPFYDSTAGTYSKDQKYNNPTVDDLIDQGVAEQDSAKREVIYRSLLQNASLDVPNIPIFEAASYNAFPVWIEGVQDDTAGTVGAGSGALHPFKANFWAYLGKADTYTFTPGYKETTTTPPTTTTTGPTTTTTSSGAGTPGFEAIALLAAAISIAAISIAKRRRK